jgi:hypothetical protein
MACRIEGTVEVKSFGYDGGLRVLQEIVLFLGGTCLSV